MLKIQYWHIFSQMYTTLDKKHKRNLLFFFCLFIFLVLENNSGPHLLTKNKQYIPTLQTCFWKQYYTSNTTIIFHLPYVMESFHFNIYWQNYFDNLSSVDHNLTNLLYFSSFLIFLIFTKNCEMIHTYTHIYTYF